MNGICPRGGRSAPPTSGHAATSSAATMRFWKKAISIGPATNAWLRMRMMLTA